MVPIDFNDRDGNWVLRWGCKDGFMQTRLGALHNNVTQRARKAGSFQRIHQGYVGVTISPMFQNAQTFCDWAVKQKGWGKGWELDKDLLGSRTYSEDGCVFLPHAVNTSIGRWKVESEGAKERRQKRVRGYAEMYKADLDLRAYHALANWTY